MGVCCSKEAVGSEEEDINSSGAIASMFTQQGQKGINQDAMILCEDFAWKTGTIFCGVFDGHGPYGHKVARHVRDNLPSKLKSECEACELDSDETEDCSERNSENGERKTEYPPEFSSWKASFLQAFRDIDRELRVRPEIDCFCSGTTAVALVKQGEHLVIANLGDSRAILCTRDDNNKMVPLQLTVDLKPNLPSEAERIKQCKGRVFAMEEEPDVARMWLPNEDCPGLAMARAFGDFCLKDYGLISVPHLSYRKLTPKDEFVVLATDGVWDVLTNKEVINIVASSKDRSSAARTLVTRAVRAWKYKYPTSKIDDCAVICLYLRTEPTVASKASSEALESVHSCPESLISGRLRDADDGEGDGFPPCCVVREGKDEEEWSALEGVTRVNSIVKLSRRS
ncbi:hypothetical protein AMTRI_Chr08g207670 [Amborella trichopoda]